MSNFKKPVDVTKLDVAFGGEMAYLLPPYAQIPNEFKEHNGNQWTKWQSDWFFNGLKQLPVAKPGIDALAAMRHLGAIQGSWAPKHEHKSAGVAYLASLWFEAPSEAKAA
jgi:hypothetical protein